MTRKVLLDANLLIAAFDGNGSTSPEIKQAAQEQLETLLTSGDVQLFITPLVRYEVLRGIAWKRQSDFSEMTRIINDFPELEVTRDISELSAHLFRYDKHQAALDKDAVKNIDKRKFDVFHFCSAYCNGLEFCSCDSDIARIGNLYQAYITAKVA